MSQKNREEYNAYMRKYMKERYHRRREAALRQLGGCCALCRCSEESKLNFDHVDASTKSFDIGKRLSGISEARLQEELKKCQILCDGCHRRKTLEAGEYKNKGSDNKASKLTEGQVLEARRRWKPHSSVDGAAALAQEFGVSRSTMSSALKRRTWKHI